jgi:uncharacterized protein
VPQRDLDSTEVTSVLNSERIVRVAFQGDAAPYLIPLGYAWHRDALYGVAQAGRKTRLAAAKPTVAIQVDTSRTSIFEWRSVTGEGRFEVVADAAETRDALAALQPIMASAPAWWQAERREDMASGNLLVWKITPAVLTGRAYEPPLPS